MQYGRLTLIEEAGKSGPHLMWRCRCECGNEIVTRKRSVVKGVTKSCGCYQKESARKCLGRTVRKRFPDDFEQYRGKRFGRLVVVNKSRIAKSGKRTWQCQCDCGVTKDIARIDVLNGSIQSCGCYARDRASLRATTMGKESRTHGLSDATEYYIWRSMKARCYRNTFPGYERYGGRGIKVCKQWSSSFSDFLKDMGPRPGPRYTIERIDNNGNYEPGNCHWALPQEQARNRRSNRTLTFNGQTKCVTEWAEETGISMHCIFKRLERGWPVEKTLTVPMGSRRPRKK